ncbi:MAG: hypothetical protein IJ716_14535 [Lachnospiraceae bacterium]|nr:hypothetical protein [Lachnospiraceae bacterium]
MKNEIVTKLNKGLTSVGYTLKKHSPEILAGAGATGIVIATVMACKATLKLTGILDEHKEAMEQVRTQVPEEEVKKATVSTYARTGLQVVKLYAPAATVGVLSLGSILASNDILRKRNVALTAAYAAVDKSYKEYRERVIKRFGEEVDYQLRTGAEVKEVEETVTDEKGKEKKVKKKINVADPNATGSGYMKYFTRSNPYWEEDSQYLEMFLRAQQNFANDKLHAEGHLTLNQVYQMLGFKDTKDGMIAGWIDDRNHPDSDGYIEFDVKEVYLPDENGNYQKAYSIDFNVDGNIYDRMV